MDGVVQCAVLLVLAAELKPFLGADRLHAEDRGIVPEIEAELPGRLDQARFQPDQEPTVLFQNGKLIERLMDAGQPFSELPEAALDSLNADAGAGEIAKGLGGGDLAEIEIADAVSLGDGPNQAREQPGPHALPRRFQEIGKLGEGKSAAASRPSIRSTRADGAAHVPGQW